MEGQKEQDVGGADGDDVLGLGAISEEVDLLPDVGVLLDVGVMLVDQQGEPAGESRSRLLAGQEFREPLPARSTAIHCQAVVGVEEHEVQALEAVVHGLHVLRSGDIPIFQDI